VTDHPRRDSEEATTGDEPMTDAQASYLRTLADDVGEPFDRSTSKADASAQIDELESRSPRSAETAAEDSGTPPHPSPAEGGTTEAAERPPRPSQAEGERTEPT
jgi:hypothetical protein